MRKYHYCDIDEMGLACWYVDGIARKRFRNEIRMEEQTDKALLANFMKCAKWVEENCPKLNGEFNCRHDPYHWTRLVVEDGKAYLEYGSHGWGFDIALSTSETAVMTRGSQQSLPYAFSGHLFFRNDALEEFLSQWKTIKVYVESANRVQRHVFSEEFTA